MSKDERVSKKKLSRRLLIKKIQVWTRFRHLTSCYPAIFLML